jgi:uncharacterized protein
MDEVKLFDGVFARGHGIYLNKEKILVISDLHIGYEEELNRKGVLVPRVQFTEYIDILLGIIDGIIVETIVINGDLKHEFGSISETEWRYVLRLLDFLSKKCKRIILIKGNHDTILGPIAKKRNVEILDEIMIGNVLITHGDKIKQTKAKTIIIGHEHPAVSIKQDGRVEKFKCFLVGKWKSKNLIVLPSMNPLLEGTDVLDGELLSPYISESNLKNFLVYVIADKVYDFGKLSYLA